MNSTPGIRPRFPSVKSYLKSYVLGLDNPAENVARLTAYGAGRPVTLHNARTKESTVYGLLDAQVGLMHVAVVQYWHGIQGALGGRADWESPWRQAVAYHYWSAQIEHAWHLHALDEFERGKRVQKLRMLFLSDFGYCLGNCLALGWFDRARHLAGSAFAAIDKGMLADGSASGVPCRIQYFVLRLLCDWQNWPARITEPYAHDEPLYESLLREWRSSDEETLTPLLLAACDRHTHEARHNTSKENFDLSLSQTWYVPFEVLSVLRLRESLGLSLPPLPHPLMQTPLGRLPPITLPHTDDLLESVLPRIAQQLPQFRME